jgi:FixJ family two-component response regulator
MSPAEPLHTEPVCLVDDDPTVLKSLERLLGADGLSVRSFKEAKSFLEYVKTNPVPVPLVILDIWMEGMNGLEIQANLSALSPGTRVIVITGRKDPSAKLTALQLGVVAFFTKPFHSDQFLSAVHGALAMPPVQ